MVLFDTPVISRCRSQHVVSVESSSLFHHRETCLCQPKNINVHSDAGDAGHSSMHYVPIHTKLCIKMRITRNILRQSYNSAVFRFDNISFSRACIQPIISSERTFNQSSILPHNGFNNLFPTAQETNHFMEWWGTSIRHAMHFVQRNRCVDFWDFFRNSLYFFSNKMFYKCSSLI